MHNTDIIELRQAGAGMNQYIITEEIVCSGCDMCNKDAASKNECSILFNVRSRPYQSEREKVLERFVAFRMVCNVKIEDETPGNYYTTLDAWKEFELLLEELRQAGEP